MAKRKFERNLLLSGAAQLPDDELKLLLELYKAGDSEAGGRLIQSQIAWIVLLVSRESMPSGVDPEDVVSELLLVLLDSLKRYDPAKAELSTYVSVVCQRRTRRIISKLAGKIKCSESPEMLAGVSKETTYDDRLDDLGEAMRMANLTPEAQLALELHLQDNRDDVVLAMVRKKYPHVCHIRRLINNSLAELRRCMRELGHDVELEEDLGLFGQI